ncbi:MAG TPA: hypothetical protein VFI91_13060, partial [Longimicrobiaceae bacterium]|nr:hypothetical protein [Longimicrobiaceae bacterium]
TGLDLYPENDVAIAVLTNRSNRYVSRIAQEIASVVLPGYAEALAAQSDEDDNEEEEGFSAPVSLLGEWSGEIHADGKRLPLSLTVKPDGDVHVKLGDEMATLLSNPNWHEGQLTGVFAGTIPGEDTARHDHMVQLNLYLREGRLIGSATAITYQEPAYFALTSFVELEKDAGQ